MARLKTLGQRLASAPQRIKPPEPTGSTFGQGRGGRPWRRLRDQILLRDQYKCRCDACDAIPLMHRAEADEVDHIIPMAEGGTDDLTNLRAINADHHREKTREEARRGAARRWA